MRLFLTCLWVVVNVYSSLSIATSSQVKTHSKCGTKCRKYDISRGINEEATLLKKKHEETDESGYGSQENLRTSTHTLDTLSKKQNIAFPSFRTENDENEDDDEDDDDGDDADDTDTVSPPAAGDIILPLDNMNNNENEAYKSVAQAKSEDMTQMLKQHYMQTAAMQSQVGAHMPGAPYGGVTTGVGNIGTPIMKTPDVKNYARHVDHYDTSTPGGHESFMKPPMTKQYSGHMPMSLPEGQFGTMTSEARGPIMKPPVKNYQNQFGGAQSGDHYGAATPNMRAPVMKPPMISDIPESSIPPGGTNNFFGGSQDGFQDGMYNENGKGIGMPQNDFGEASMTNSFATGMGHDTFGNNHGEYQDTNMGHMGSNMENNSPNMENMSPNMENMNPNMRHMDSNMNNMNPNMRHMDSNMNNMNLNMENMSPNMENMSPNTGNNGHETEEDGDEEEGDDTPGAGQDKLDPVMAEEVNKWQDSLDPMVSKIYQESALEKNVKETLTNPNKYISSEEKYLSDADKYLPKANNYLPKVNNYLPHQDAHRKGISSSHGNLHPPPNMRKTPGKELSVDYTDTTSRFMKNNDDEKSFVTHYNKNPKKSLLHEGFVGSLYDNLLAEDQSILSNAFGPKVKTPKKEVAVQEHGGKRHFPSKLENEEKEEYKTKDGISLEKLLNVITPTEESTNNDDISASSRTLAEDQKALRSDQHPIVPLSTIDEWANDPSSVSSAPSESSSNSSVSASSERSNASKIALDTLPDSSKRNSNVSESKTNSPSVGSNATSNESNNFKGFTIVGNKGDESVVVAITITKPSNITNNTGHSGLSPLDNKAIGNVITSMINAAASNKGEEALGVTSHDTSRDEVHTPAGNLVNNTGDLKNTSSQDISHTTLSNGTKSSSSSSSNTNVSSVLLEDNANISSIVTNINNMIHPSLQYNITNASAVLPSNSTVEPSALTSAYMKNISTPIDEEDTASKCLLSRTCRKKVLSKFIDSSDVENGGSSTIKPAAEDTKSVTRAAVDKKETSGIENKTVIEKNETIAVDNKKASGKNETIVVDDKKASEKHETIAVDDEIASEKNETIGRENKTNAHEVVKSLLKKHGAVVIEITERDVKPNVTVKIEDDEKAQAKDTTSNEHSKSADRANINVKDITEIQDNGSVDDRDYVKNTEESRVGDLPKVVKKSSDWKSKTNKVRQNFIVSRLINKNLQRIEEILKKYHGYQKKYKQFIDDDGVTVGVTKSHLPNPSKKQKRRAKFP